MKPENVTIDRHGRTSRLLSFFAVAALAAVLAACGGGGSSGGDSSAVAPTPVVPTPVAPTPVVPTPVVPTPVAPTPVAPTPVVPTPVVPTPVEPPASAPQLPSSRAEAVRFLTQATFGATPAEIDHVMAVGYSAWLDEQFAKPQTLHLDSWNAANAAIKAVTPTSSAGTREVLDSFYRQALTGNDQLRQRVVFALSQIFVISMADGSIADNAQGVASYLDMLGANAFGNYRTLIEGVSRHPMMGIYLSHMKNQKEDPVKGRVPDENYAREVMQLFSIGLYQLNADGSLKTGTNGNPVETYTAADISGLAKVFTGWSWDGPDTADARFYGYDPGFIDPARRSSPMQGYTQFHSVTQKDFLGVTVAAQTRADPSASLRVAMDTLAAHPNVGPFIGKQLIQRLVTSNPSPAYVSRVAKAFSSSGDMKAMVKAVLTDAEARDLTLASGQTYGKLREPVLRMTAFLRAFGATSDSGKFLIGGTNDPGLALSQSPLYSPSVFNFYRPGYVPPDTLAGKAGLVVPEMQITHETSVAGYANFMRLGIQSGFGLKGTDNTAARQDVQVDYSALLALTDNSATLVDTVLTLLLGPAPQGALKAEIVPAVDSIAVPALKADGSNQAAVTSAKRNRVYTAVYLVLVAPEFLVQK